MQLLSQIYIMKYLVTILLLLSINVLSAQSSEDINLLQTDTTWRKETLRFPFPFAQEIELEGEIDVRFTHGWSDVDSPYFWSYAFAWSMQNAEVMTVAEIEDNMELYLGGLMKVVNRDTSFVVPSTVALFSETDSTHGKNNYIGKIKMHDSFFSKQMITLHVKGEQFYCETDQCVKFFCKLSPQDYSSVDVWKHLEDTHWDKSDCRQE